MRHLVVCCDGTWMTSRQLSVTNVKRLFDALTDRDASKHEQLRHYQPGVGTEGDALARLKAGAVGADLDGKIIGCYQWLTAHYRKGDRIALFGFSRGAYTARSLAGMIAKCGLIDTARLDAAESGRQIERIYRQRYQFGPPDDRRWREKLRFGYDPDDVDEIPIEFIGVWDTVGALGIPEHLSWLDPLNPAAAYTFHDVKLNPHVPHARHAVAMDERRRPFTPALWRELATGQDVQQVWFPGGHTDVGGGNPERGLSDGALQWMIDQAREAVGLGFHETTLRQIRPDPVDILHNDVSGVASDVQLLLGDADGSLSQLVWDVRPRAIPLIDQHQSQKCFHESVFERQRNVPISSGAYRPSRALRGGESVDDVEVLAAEPWNETGIYLPPGQYSFVAQGQWAHFHSKHQTWFGPDGCQESGSSSVFSLLQRTVSGFLDRFADVYRHVTGQTQASFPGQRREPDLPWMSLVGIVANDAVTVNGTTRHQRIAIGDHTPSEHVIKGGYFYAFANDAWGQYGHNHGSVRLSITRIR